MSSSPGARSGPRRAQLAVLGAAIALAVIAVLVLAPLRPTTQMDPSPRAADPGVASLALDGAAPAQTYTTAVGTWYGLNVRFCNQATTAVGYVPVTAVLHFADGTKATARNGYGPGPHSGGAPTWLGDARQWMDTATLLSSECATGWLVFYSIVSPPPERLEWMNLSLEVSSAF